MSNLRKRGRDVSVSAPIINPLCFQPQIIDLSQLHNHHHPSNVVSTGLRLSSGDQGLNPHHHPPPRNDDNLVSLSSSVFISNDFSSQIKGQRDEIDQFLQAQVWIWKIQMEFVEIKKKVLIFFFFFILFY